GVTETTADEKARAAAWARERSQLAKDRDAARADAATARSKSHQWKYTAGSVVVAGAIAAMFMPQLAAFGTFEVVLAVFGMVFMVVTLAFETLETAMPSLLIGGGVLIAIWIIRQKHVG